jgi:hypothetical protein
MLDTKDLCGSLIGGNIREIRSHESLAELAASVLVQLTCLDAYRCTGMSVLRSRIEKKTNEN